MSEKLQETLQKGSKEIAKDDLQLGPDLMKSIEKETVNKTGDKFLTWQKVKDFLKGSTALEATGNWLNRNKTGAIFSLACGAVPLLWGLGMPGISLGVAGAAIVAATILKKSKKRQIDYTNQGR